MAFPNLFADLCRLLPAEQAGRLDALYRDPKVSAGDKMASLLAALPAEPVVLLLDNLEDLLDEGRALRDGELDEVLRALLRAAGHGVKAIVTTRVPPGELLLVHPERQQRLDLDEGLASPYAENILRAMDRDGKVGLRDAPEDLLATARERTRGYPAGAGGAVRHPVGGSRHDAAGGAGRRCGRAAGARGRGAGGRGVQPPGPDGAAGDGGAGGVWPARCRRWRWTSCCSPTSRAPTPARC